MTGPEETSPTVTSELLRGARKGDKESLDTHFTLAYQEMRRIAHRKRSGRDATLSTTPVVHEA